MIDYVEKLREKADLLEKSGYATCGLVQDYRNCAGTIEKLLKQLQADRWIPCNEKLPESDKKVLLAVDVDGNKVVTIGMLVYDVWLMEDEYYSYTSANWEVQAWQPLPEPYKGE